MRIVIFIGSLSGGGAERVACNLANYLAEQKHTVEIITMADSANHYNLNDQVIHTSLIKKSERKNKLYDFFLREYRLFRIVKEKTVDAYVVMLPVTILMLMALKPFSKAKVIISERNDPSKYASVMQKAMKYVSQKADGMVFQTTNAQNWYGITNPEKSAVIPNAINPVFLRDAYTGARNKEIVAAGRLNTQKNFPLLLRAFAKIADTYPDYKLVIYGQGAQKEALVRLAEELEIAERVCFPGFVSDMPEALEKAEMFVLSSDFEGMPNALMEAMALGLPCVSTDCGGGGARFLIEDGVNGLLVPVGDDQAMADAMAYILRDPNSAAILGRNARNLQNTLSHDVIYSQWEMFIDNIAEGNKK